MDNKTISNLDSKIWYRFLKVIFITVFFIVLLGLNVTFFDISRVYNQATSIYVFSFLRFIKFFFIGNFIFLLIFEAIRRAFYYIVLGAIRPKK